MRGAAQAGHHCRTGLCADLSISPAPHTQGCMNNFTFGDAGMGYYETIAGGAGAGPGWHGRRCGWSVVEPWACKHRKQHSTAASVSASFQLHAHASSQASTSLHDLPWLANARKLTQLNRSLTLTLACLYPPPPLHPCSGVHTHMTNTRITDPEILERRYPVVLHQFRLRPGVLEQGNAVCFLMSMAPRTEWAA